MCVSVVPPPSPGKSCFEHASHCDGVEAGDFGKQLRVGDVIWSPHRTMLLMEEQGEWVVECLCNMHKALSPEFNPH